MDCWLSVESNVVQVLISRYVNTLSIEMSIKGRSILDHRCLLHTWSIPSMPTLPNYLGVSWIQTKFSGLSYGLNLPDKKVSAQSTFFKHFWLFHAFCGWIGRALDYFAQLPFWHWELKIKLVISRISILLGWHLCCSSEKEPPLSAPEPKIHSAPSPHSFTLASLCLIMIMEHSHLLTLEGLWPNKKILT